jgi:hypothetical protein
VKDALVKLFFGLAKSIELCDGNNNPAAGSNAVLTPHYLAAIVMPLSGLSSWFRLASPLIKALLTVKAYGLKVK